MGGDAAPLRVEMQDALLRHHYRVDRAPVRQQCHPARQALLGEMAGAVAPAVLLVAGDRQAERNAGVAVMQLGEQGHENGQRALHVAGARPVDAAVAHLRAIEPEGTVVDHVDVRQQQHLRPHYRGGPHHQGGDAGAAVLLQAQAGDGVELDAQQVEAAFDLGGMGRGAGDQDQVAGERYQAVAQRGVSVPGARIPGVRVLLSPGHSATSGERPAPPERRCAARRRRPAPDTATDSWRPGGCRRG